MKILKKTILLTTSLPLMLAGCINDGYDGSGEDLEPIRFSTSVDSIESLNATRAPYTSTMFAEFQVTALGNAAAYFQNLKVTKQTDGSWQTASVKYWPAYPLKFYGYAPVSLQGQITIDPTQQKLTGYQPAASAASQTDIVTAYVLANQNSAGGAAVLGFRHALSQIEVVAKNGLPTNTPSRCSALSSARCLLRPT